MSCQICVIAKMPAESKDWYGEELRLKILDKLCTDSDPTWSESYHAKVGVIYWVGPERSDSSQSNLMNRYSSNTSGPTCSMTMITTVGFVIRCKNLTFSHFGWLPLNTLQLYAYSSTSSEILVKVTEESSYFKLFHQQLFSGSSCFCSPYYTTVKSFSLRPQGMSECMFPLFLSQGFALPLIFQAVHLPGCWILLESPALSPFPCLPQSLGKIDKPAHTAWWTSLRSVFWETLRG